MDFLGALIACKKGTSLAVGDRGTVHVYPYIHDNPSGPQRTSDELNAHSHEAIKKDEPVFGVKGPTWLSVIPNYSVINGNVVNYMHCVLSGVTKMLLKLWFSK